MKGVPKTSSTKKTDQGIQLHEIQHPTYVAVSEFQRLLTLQKECIDSNGLLNPQKFNEFDAAQKKINVTEQEQQEDLNFKLGIALFKYIKDNHDSAYTQQAFELFKKSNLTKALIFVLRECVSSDHGVVCASIFGGSEQFGIVLLLLKEFKGQNTKQSSSDGQDKNNSDAKQLDETAEKSVLKDDEKTLKDASTFAAVAVIKTFFKSEKNIESTTLSQLGSNFYYKVALDFLKLSKSISGIRLLIDQFYDEKITDKKIYGKFLVIQKLLEDFSREFPGEKLSAGEYYQLTRMWIKFRELFIGPDKTITAQCFSFAIYHANHADQGLSDTFIQDKLLTFVMICDLSFVKIPQKKAVDLELYELAKLLMPELQALDVDKKNILIAWLIKFIDFFITVLKMECADYYFLRAEELIIKYKLFDKSIALQKTCVTKDRLIDLNIFYLVKKHQKRMSEAEFLPSQDFQAAQVHVKYEIGLALINSLANVVVVDCKDSKTGRILTASCQDQELQHRLKVNLPAERKEEDLSIETHGHEVSAVRVIEVQLDFRDAFSQVKDLNQCKATLFYFVAAVDQIGISVDSHRHLMTLQKSCINSKSKTIDLDVFNLIRILQKTIYNSGLENTIDTYQNFLLAQLHYDLGMALASTLKVKMDATVLDNETIAQIRNCFDYAVEQFSFCSSKKLKGGLIFIHNLFASYKNEEEKKTKVGELKMELLAKMLQNDQWKPLLSQTSKRVSLSSTTKSSSSLFPQSTIGHPSRNSKQPISEANNGGEFIGAAKHNIQFKGANE